ncbi:hypothetical protein TNCV_2281131 [Trichonephila clavipes]|nr:hypothetical protein TNCV_2281131 [Trichonephila clavipes]
MSREWDSRTQVVRWTRLGRPRDFCGLPMRKDEGRVVDPPLVFKKSFFRRQGGSPGGRELEESPKERPRLEWRGRKDDEHRWR